MYETRLNAYLYGVGGVRVCVASGRLWGDDEAAHNRYPNELQGFKFYAKYLVPLLPGVSNPDEVRRALGDTAAVKRNGWTIMSNYMHKDGKLHKTLGSLHALTLRPDGVIPMQSVKFPPKFWHCHEFISEYNISFDVYSDTSGLEYWLHEEDSTWGSKGDLFWIVYGAKKRPLPRNTFC